MKIFKYIACICFISLLCYSCIDELDIDTETAQNLLVVEGGITTAFGPHEILLSKSAKYGSILEDDIKKETNATVFLRNQNGDQEFLEEGSDGSYYTSPNFAAKVGDAYSLIITLANGERYISTKQTIEPVPEIDSLILIWKKQPSLSDIQFASGVEVYAQWKDPEDVKNYYQWKTGGVYKINTRPDLHVGRGFGGNPFPDPKDCCETCYIYETNGDLNIYKDNLSNGNTITEKVGYVEDDGGRFMEKYLVIVQQVSLSKEAFQFYELLQNQLSIQGDIFDPPPAKITSNFINLDNPNEDIIGFFTASDIKIDSVFIDNDIIEERQPVRQVLDDCRVLDNSTVDIPPFWN